MPEIAVNQDLCIGCGACVELCSVTSVFTLNQGKAEVTSPRRCWNCGQCVAVCPVDAIQHSNFLFDACPAIQKNENGFELLTNVFHERRSIRVFKNKSIDRKTVQKIIDAARWAPSARNLQFIIWQAIDDQQLITLLEKEVVQTLAQAVPKIRESANEMTGELLKSLVLSEAKSHEHVEKKWLKGERPVFFGAPLLLFAITPNWIYGRDDAVISGYSIELAAQQLGLASCQVGNFISAQEINPEVGREILNIPPDHSVQMALAIGYPKYILRRYVPRSPLHLEWIDNYSGPSTNI